MSTVAWREKNEEQAGLMGDGSIASGFAQASYYKKRYNRLIAVVVFLTLVVAGLGSILAVVVSQKQNTNEHDQLRSWMPPQNRVNKVFWPNDQFAINPDDESEKAWDSLFPRIVFPVGGSYVDLTNDASFPSDIVGSERRAGVSVFHQLHCLRLVRQGYFVAASGNPDDVEQGPGHLGHCWDYLQQAITCSSDMTLEFVHEGDPGSSGWGYEHQCNDFAAILAWVNDRNIVNHTGIATTSFSLHDKSHDHSHQG
ncbi:hypothetical protein F4678DRAFT_443007 [Xylaria arbuscula]|nr:hypothetical protein F4678DRAFT_443007 [Xylaria arbuscula]